MQGTVVNERYVLRDFLGRGGMGQVYRAHDELLDREVALKLLAPQHAENPSFVERFRREVKNAAALSHPNIVSVFDAGESAGGVPYMAMEYVGGGTLAQKIDKEGPLDALEAAGIALQVARALEEAHSRGVIHRDIKPHNVFLVEELASTGTSSAGITGADPGGLPPGSVKVGDFGIARAAAETAMTETSLILGTVRYLSPEQATGEAVGPASDLYSLGVVLYEMLTGEVPFDAENPVAIAIKHVSEPPPPPRRENPGVPENLQAITLNLLSKDPGDRYAEAGELLEDLERVARGLPPARLPAEDATEALERPGSPPARGGKHFVPARRSRFRRRFGTMLVLAGVLAALAVAGSTGGLAALTGASGDQEAAQPVGGVQEVPEPSGIEAPVVLVGIPDVVGESREEAVQTLEDAGFEAEVDAQETSAREEGTVLSQAPEPGNRAERGSEVSITVAEAPPAVQVPDLTGLSVAEAEAALSEAGLVLGEQSQTPSGTMPAGLILGQNLQAGEEVSGGSSVDVTVSSGPPEPAATPQPAPVPEAPEEEPQEPQAEEPQEPRAEEPQEPQAEEPQPEEPRGETPEDAAPPGDAGPGDDASESPGEPEAGGPISRMPVEPREPRMPDVLP